MSAAAGIGRDAVGLRTVLTVAEQVRADAARPDRLSVETANLGLAAGALATAALARAESRGCHVRVDHPDRADRWARSIGVRLADGRLRASVLERAAVPVDA